MPSDTIVQFDFSEALTLLKQGKRVRRLGWASLYKYFEMRGQDLYQMGTLAGPVRRTNLLWSDIRATDWVVVEEALTTLKT